MCFPHILESIVRLKREIGELLINPQLCISLLKNV